MGAEKSFNSGPYRKHRAEVQAHAEKLLEEGQAPPSVFGRAFGLFYDQELLGDDEKQDFANLMLFIRKRLAAGAISSRAYHAEVTQGNIQEPLADWVPSSASGHDEVHAMFAYLRSGGKSLVPAYMQVEKQGDELGDQAANLEEDYVTTFSNLGSKRALFLKYINREREAPGPGTDRVREALENFESRINRDVEDPNFMNVNRIPEFEVILRRLYKDLQSDTPDPNFPFHEFMRVFAPVVERLRKGQEPAVEGAAAIQ